MKIPNHHDQKKTQYQKAFLVTEDTHSLVKQYCKEKNIKINIWVDNMLKDFINKSAGIE
jgi:hypothetical protein